MYHYKARQHLTSNIATLLTSSRSQPEFTLSSKADLVALLKSYAPRGALTVKVLKESWPSVGPAIEELEKEGKVLVTRTNASGDKEGQLKAVFLDEFGPVGQIDEGELILLYE